MKTFIKEVKVVDNEASIEYTLPMPPEKLLVGKAGVLSIVQNGSAYGIRTRGLVLERDAS
jgi:hypothetical protein